MEERKLEISIKILEEIIMSSYYNGWFDNDKSNNEFVSYKKREYCKKVLERMNIKWVYDK